MKNPEKKPRKKPPIESDRLSEIRVPKIENKKPDIIKPEIFEQFSPHLKIQLNELMEFENIISEKLKDPKQQEMFVKKPVEFFSRNKIKVSPFIERRLREFDFSGFVPSETFVMPNGQRITPKLKITIK